MSTLFIKKSWEKIKDEVEKENLLVELNVKEQVLNLAKISIIQKAWQKNQKPTLHGWVYGLKDGLLKDLCIVKPNTKIEDI